MRDKILLLDEVHAMMVIWLNCWKVCGTHAAEGRRAIILSATLPAALRGVPFSDGAGFMSAGGSDNAGYPWLSHLTSSGLLEHAGYVPEVQGL